MTLGVCDGSLCRKICSSAALFYPPSALHAHEQLHAVILLNSPTNNTWDFEEYARLWSWYRVGAAGQRRRCFFICADGAYQGLVRYFASSNARVVPTCDAVIGDMDSFGAAAARYHVGDGEAAGCECDKAASEVAMSFVEDTGVMYDTVSSIPADIIDRLHARAGAPSDSTPMRPLLLPIRCQLTTDFQKSTALLAALQKRFPIDFTSADSNSSAAQHSERDVLHRAAEAARATTSSDNSSLDAYYGDERERARVVSLLHDIQQSFNRCHNDASRGAENNNNNSSSDGGHTHVLPAVAVLGALGGRFDHEMATMSCLVEYSEVFHLMVTNAFNVMFACWPSGVTQWLPTSTDPSPPSMPDKAAAAGSEGTVCGFIPFGTVQALETSGLQYNMVNGKAHQDRYDGVTQTKQFTFAFGQLISTSNGVVGDVVTLDLRVHGSEPNPPSLITCNRVATAPTRL